MNENPEETPNPLNANPEPNSNMLDANPAEPLHETDNRQETAASAHDEVVVTERITEETTAEKQAADAEWASITENEPAAKREGNRESDTRPMADERMSASERATDEHTSERAADMDSGRMTDDGTAAEPEQLSLTNDLRHQSELRLPRK